MTLLLSLLLSVAASDSRDLHETKVNANVRGKALLMRVAVPVNVAGRPLVVYFSGDLGWFPSTPFEFDDLKHLGYPSIGISSREYLHHFTPTTAPALAEDIAAIITQARRAAGLPDATPAIVTGTSRGADLVVIAAAQPALQDVGGVVALGISPTEEQLHSGKVDVLAQLSSVKCRAAIIQAAGDRYITAAKLRTLIGEDSDRLRLFVNPSDAHSFRGQRKLLIDQLSDALNWVTGRNSELRNKN